MIYVMNTSAKLSHSLRLFFKKSHLLAALFFVVALVAPSVRAQTVTQSFALNPGWNAIWLDVQPTNSNIGVVFSNIPVASVWTFLTPVSPAQFISNPTEETLRKAGWLGYFPPTPSNNAGVYNNLFAVYAGQAYLINLGTNPGVMLNIVGTPVIKKADWVSDSYNLRGFPVSPTNPPTFNTFFAPSFAHTNQAKYKYRMSDNGSNWIVAASGDVMKNGEAYWVYCDGNSSYQAPTGLELEDGESLKFARSLGTVTTHIRNNTASTGSVAVRDLFFPGTNGPLSYQEVSTNGSINWLPFPALNRTTAASEISTLRLAIRRKDMATTNYQSVLEVTDTLGTYYRLGVTAAKALPATGAAANVGLWVGTATITNVSEAHSTNAALPTPVKSGFDLRLLVHVDTNGVARLLKDVIMMWKDGTYTNNAQGVKVTSSPGYSVLLTDDSLLPNYTGSALRDGTSVGRRLSSVDFDFPPHQGTNNFLPFTGTFAIGSSISNRVIIAPDFATNPFKHKYHPDHDNLDARFLLAKDEAYRIQRDFTLAFSSSPPVDEVGSLGLDLQDFGYSVLGGTYTETIQGLHRTNIVASGYFRLKRVAEIGVLNR